MTVAEDAWGGVGEHMLWGWSVAGNTCMGVLGAHAWRAGSTCMTGRLTLHMVLKSHVLQTADTPELDKSKGE